MCLVVAQVQFPAVLSRERPRWGARCCSRRESPRRREASTDEAGSGHPALELGDVGVQLLLAALEPCPEFGALALLELAAQDLQPRVWRIWCSSSSCSRVSSSCRRSSSDSASAKWSRCATIGCRGRRGRGGLRWNWASSRSRSARRRCSTRIRSLFSVKLFSRRQLGLRLHQLVEPLADVHGRGIHVGAPLLEAVERVVERLAQLGGHRPELLDSARRCSSSTSARSSSSRSVSSARGRPARRRARPARRRFSPGSSRASRGASR